MNEVLVQLEQLTASFLKNLEQTTVEEIELFLENRESLVAQINTLLFNKAYSSDEEQRIIAVLQYDSLIVARMEELKVEAANWLQNREQAKIQRNAYDVSYSAGSIIMDKRK